MHTLASLPRIGLGTWSFGSDEIWWGKQKTADSIEVLNHLTEKGISLIDTAPIYGRGKSETLIGQFFSSSGLRNRFIIATKCGLTWNGKSVSHNLKRESILKEFDESRKRLQTDFIDIYQVHHPDPETPIEETAETLQNLLARGLIRRIGICNFTADQIHQFGKHAELTVVQDRFNLLETSALNLLLPTCREKHIDFIAYSPLEHGILTGKYLMNGKRPDGLLRRKNIHLNDAHKHETAAKLGEWTKRAEAEGKTLTQYALHWVITQPGVSSVLVGCRKPEQLSILQIPGS